MSENMTRPEATDGSIADRVRENTLGLQLDIDSLTRLQWVAIALTALTGIDHLYLYWTQGLVPFLLAGIGFFGAIGLLLTTFSRRLLYWVGIPYTGIQIVAWVAVGMPSFTLGVLDKVVQVLLIVLLAYFLRKGSS